MRRILSHCPKELKYYFLLPLSGQYHKCHVTEFFLSVSARKSIIYFPLVAFSIVTCGVIHWSRAVTESLHLCLISFAPQRKFDCPRQSISLSLPSFYDQPAIVLLTGFRFCDIREQYSGSQQIYGLAGMGKDFLVTVHVLISHYCPSLKVHGVGTGRRSQLGPVDSCRKTTQFTCALISRLQHQEEDV